MINNHIKEKVIVMKMGENDMIKKSLNYTKTKYLSYNWGWNKTSLKNMSSYLG